MATRNSTKSTITITDPNRPAAAQENGAAQDGSASEATDSESGVHPSSTDDHPSSTVGPAASAARPAVSRKEDSTWTTLDMGGIRLKNITPALFKYTYLTTLYLNHNHISRIPPEIASLRNLKLLDVSGNALMSIPPELGMLTSLQELYLFDNHLTSLPPELGSLHQLEMLGIEGNPMDASIKAMVQKDGTAALIAYLRDTCPVGMPPGERVWTSMQSDAERKLQDADPSLETFTVLCYNILCEKAATSQLYGYTPSWALAWDYRKELILQELMNFDADFVSLQEIDIAQYEDYFSPHLAAQDYESVYWPRSRANTMGGTERRRVDGCAIFYKASKYQLIEKELIEFTRIALHRPDFMKTDDMFSRLLTKDHIAVVALFEHRTTGSRLIVANLHLYWNHEYRDVKLVQVALLMDELEKIASRFSKLPPRLPSEADIAAGIAQRPPSYVDPAKIPVIVSGDFNSVPDSGVYEYLANGSVPGDHADFMNHNYGQYTASGVKHRFGLKNAYASLTDRAVTNVTPGFQGMIDYIWYTGGTLTLSSLLGEVDPNYLSRAVGFPNAHFPSDHVCLMAEFRLKPQKESAAVARPQSAFPTTNGIARNS